MKKFIIVVIVLLLIAGGLYLYFNQDGKNPVSFMNQYAEKINEEDYSSMYQMITNDSKSKISEEDFIARNKNIYSGIEMGNMQISINGIKIKSLKKYNVSYTTKMNTSGGEISFENTANLVKGSEGKLQLEWTSNVIFPNLNDTEKVRVSSNEAKRGSILDREGTALAINRKCIISWDSTSENLLKTKMQISKKWQNY